MASKTTIHCCFRGEDTRNSFTGFLFQALSRKGTIDAFKDGKDLKKGESIAPELIQAIQGSRLFFIVVFSNNYAFSTIRKKLQYAEIEDLEKITNILGHKFSSLPNDDLVGMESCVKELAKLLRLGSVNDIQVVGMSGIGGIGKTTLGHGFYAMLARELIVLDNVDQVGLLKMFPRSRDTLLRECLGEGGRIIIISRDKHILMRHGVDDVYQVQALDHEHAVQLVCRNAFKRRLGNLSNELGYLTWNEYPFECLPPSFELDNPVRLLLPNSNIKQLWEGMKKHKFLAIEQNEGKNQGKRSKGRISAEGRKDAAKPSLENSIKLLQIYHQKLCKLQAKEKWMLVLVGKRYFSFGSCNVSEDDAISVQKEEKKNPHVRQSKNQEVKLTN
ncbi:Toll/interleukin-1 receptor-like protein [Glycine max]|nr:Toll/interleukin-1 receptor-like protein [Glycine max]